tara:strand:- start:9 stop:449 length:441 start_codon:yes stop_codon:yes gene_type:complete
MSKIALSLKIDVSKIDKARLFSGQKGTYLDATIFVELAELDQYGNSGMITQDVTKEEKAQGVKGNILGNGKVFWVENGQAPQPQGQGGYQQQSPQQQGGFQQQPQQQGGFNQQQPTQQLAQKRQQAQQQAQQKPAPDINFDDDIPF